MRTEDVTGSTTVNGEEKKYKGTITLFDSVVEYQEWAEGDGGLAKEGEGSGQVLKAINDYERRRQRANMRPGTSGATGAREYEKQISEKLKSGEVTKEQLNKALASLKINVPA